MRRTTDKSLFHAYHKGGVIEDGTTPFSWDIFVDVESKPIDDLMKFMEQMLGLSKQGDRRERYQKRQQELMDQFIDMQPRGLWQISYWDSSWFSGSKTMFSPDHMRLISHAFRLNNVRLNVQSFLRTLRQDEKRMRKKQRMPDKIQRQQWRQQQRKSNKRLPGR